MNEGTMSTGNTITLRLDRAFVKHLLRCWGNNSLRPQGVVLRKERPKFIEKQSGLCPLCQGPPLLDDGKLTHLDHIVTVNEFADRVFSGAMSFEDAYIALWSDENVRAVHSRCNYERNRRKRRKRLR